jgi:hypothetical protein
MTVVFHLKPGTRLLQQRDRKDLFRDAASWSTGGETRDERDRRREEVEREAFVDSRDESRRDDLSCVVDACAGHEGGAELIDQNSSCVEQSPPSVEVVDNARKKGENANFDRAGKREILAPGVQQDRMQALV